MAGQDGTGRDQGARRGVMLYLIILTFSPFVSAWVAWHWATRMQVVGYNQGPTRLRAAGCGLRATAAVQRDTKQRGAGQRASRAARYGLRATRHRAGGAQGNGLQGSGVHRHVAGSGAQGSGAQGSGAQGGGAQGGGRKVARRRAQGGEAQGSGVHGHVAGSGAQGSGAKGSEASGSEAQGSGAQGGGRKAAGRKAEGREAAGRQEARLRPAAGSWLHNNGLWAAGYRAPWCKEEGNGL